MGNGSTKSSDSKADAHTDADEQSVREIWRKYVAEDPDQFFYEIYQRLMKQNKGIENLFKGKMKEPEKMRHFTSDVGKFLGNLVQRENKNAQVKKMAKRCGNRHACYADWTFETNYWDLFLDAFTEILREKQKTPNEKELATWREFLKVVIKEMCGGYEKTKAKMIKQSAHSFDDISDDLEFSD